MQLTRDHNLERHIIQSYEPGCITIDEKKYTRSLVLSPSQLIANWPPQSLSELTQDHLKIIIDARPSLLLLGTGIRFNRPPASLLAPLYEARIGVECMDTGAACRTYIVLSAEGRNVVTALLIH